MTGASVKSLPGRPPQISGPAPGSAGTSHPARWALRASILKEQVAGAEREGDVGADLVTRVLDARDRVRDVAAARRRRRRDRGRDLGLRQADAVDRDRVERLRDL